MLYKNISIKCCSLHLLVFPPFFLLSVFALLQVNKSTPTPPKTNKQNKTKTNKSKKTNKTNNKSPAYYTKRAKKAKDNSYVRNFIGSFIV